MDRRARPDDAPPPLRRPAAGPREARLRAALLSNVARRKAQARERRDEDAPGDASDDAPGGRA